VSLRLQRTSVSTSHGTWVKWVTD